MASDRKIAQIQKQAAEASRKMAERAKQSPLGAAKQRRESSPSAPAAPKITPGADPTFDGGGGGFQQPYVPPAQQGTMDPQRLLEQLQGAGRKRR